MKGFKNKEFLPTMIMMAVPITIQSFITSSLNLVDNLMVGKLGEESIASVGLANQYIFIFTLCILGINAGASVFMSQFWGKKDLKNIKDYIAEDNEEYAIKTIKEIYGKFENLQMFPGMGADLSKRVSFRTDYKYAIWEDYVIIYKVSNEFVEIYRVINRYQDITRIFD